MCRLINKLTFYRAVGIGLPATNFRLHGLRCDKWWDSMWNPVGVLYFFPFQPSVRFATLGFGVELLCSSYQIGFTSIKESGFSNPPIRRGEACLAHVPDQPIQSSGFYANGVKLQSPASRSARWVAHHPHDRTPTGFHNESTFHPAVTAENIRHLCERINGT